MCARERVAGRVVGVTSVGVIIDPRRRTRAEADTFFVPIGCDFVVDDGQGEWEMVEGVMPSCAEGDGLGGVAETEGARVRRQEKLAMAPEAREWLPSL